MSAGRSGNGPLVVIAAAIGAIIIWALINGNKQVRLCTVAPCLQPSATASNTR